MTSYRLLRLFILCSSPSSYPFPSLIFSILHFISPFLLSTSISQVIKDDCQKDLDDAIPACEAALKAIATLDRESLQEMCGSTNPPEMIKLTMEAVCIMFGAQPGERVLSRKKIEKERESGRERRVERVRQR